MMTPPNEEVCPPFLPTGILDDSCSSQMDGIGGPVSCLAHSITLLVTKMLEQLMQLFSNQQNDIRRLEVENKTLQVELGRLNVGLQAIQEQLCQSENSFQHAKVESIALQQDMLKSCQNTTIQYETGHRAIDTRYEGLSLRKVKQNRHRSCTIPIDFPRAFASTPKVTLGLTMVDTNTNAYTRVRLAVKSVGKDHFVAELLTWSDSVVYAVEFDWVATNLGS